MTSWRRGRDSNPRRACTLNGFQDRRNRPLCHPSAFGELAPNRHSFKTISNCSCVHEIARYGTLISWAELLGETQAVNLLNETLEEERAAGKLRPGLAVE